MYIVMRPESGERSVEEKQLSDSGKEGEKASQEDGDEKNDTKSRPRGGGHGEEVTFVLLYRFRNPLLFRLYLREIWRV